MDHDYIIRNYFLLMVYHAVDIVTYLMCDYRRGLDWWMDLLTTYTHHSEVQIITTLSLISTLQITTP
jgi:hypothetical protein